MATQLANAQAVLDALADSLGKTVDAAQKGNIVEEFLNDVGGAGTNEEKAAAFNAKLVEIIRKVGQNHVKRGAIAANQGAVDTAVAGAVSGNLSP